MSALTLLAYFVLLAALAAEVAAVLILLAPATGVG